jgi:hypothetical protein
MVLEQHPAEAEAQRSLLLLPDDIWEHILERVEPTEVCSFGCSTTTTRSLAGKRKAGVLLGRLWGRLHLRAVRQAMQARSTFVTTHCSLEELHSREACQASILETLQASPDPLPDLAAALQKGLTIITSQDEAALHHSTAAPIRKDLVRCANYVCLLAWRQRRGMRHRLAAAQQVVLQQVPPALAAEAAAYAAAQQHAVQLQEQQQQQQAPDGAAAPAAEAVQPPQPALAAAAVQTELGPTLQELQQLLSGFGALMAAPGNPSLRMTRPSLNLMQFLLAKELQVWNVLLPAAQQQPMAVGAVAGVVEDGAAAGNGGGDGGGVGGGAVEDGGQQDA